MRKYVLVLAATLALGACAAPRAAAPQAPAPVPQAAQSTQTPEITGGNVAPAGAIVQVVETTELGRVLVDATGKTLYRSDKDKVGASTCWDACLKKWTPVAFTAGRKVDGLDAALIGKALRRDGSEQLTVNGWPVYTYLDDTQSGDVKGNGISKVFWAIGVDGKKAQKPVVDQGY
jgi:predicted lipoprotein with Yx(FWY)xxD motif